MSCNPDNIWDSIKKIARTTSGNVDIELVKYFKTILDNCYIGIQEPITEKKSTSKKGKRKPSGYNIFIGKCMKSGKAMKQCASEYKGLSPNEKSELKVLSQAE